RLGRRQRGAIADVVLGEEPEHFQIAEVTVFDRLDARERRPLHALLRLRVRHYRHARVLRSADDQLQLVQCEGRARSAVRAVRQVGVDLDPVRPAADLLAYHRAEFLAVGLVRALRDAPFRGELSRGVGAGGNYCFGGHEQARAGNDALVDGGLDADI